MAADVPMLYHTTDARGVSEISPPPQRMREILDSVRKAGDADHPDVWLTNDSNGWTLTYTAGNVLVLENPDSDEARPRYMRNIPPTQALALWQLLAQGDIRSLLGMDWERA